MPNAPRIKPVAEVIEDTKLTPQVHAPEYWVPRQEIPFSKEYIGLQIKVAKEIAQRLGAPLSKVADDYTTVLRYYTEPNTPDYIDTSTMSDEQAAEAIFEKEKTRLTREAPIKYSDYDRYGCFSFMTHTGGTGEDLKGRVDIHFSNKELDGTGPLDHEKINRRLKELKDLFTAIKKENPDAKYVRGDSWLYNIQAYTRLFPESYLAHPEIDNSEGALVTERTWGQFVDGHLQLKAELGEQFLKNIRELAEVSPETVRGAMPLQALIVTAPIEDFYKMYGVE